MRSLLEPLKQVARSLRSHRELIAILLLALLAVPAAALDTLYLVRHAEKAFWPSDRDLDAFQPLSQEGIARAAALAERLKAAGIAAVYTSRTTRTIETAAPLAQASGVPIAADDATTKPDEMTSFLSRLREKHAADKAVLIVGHSNTIPELLRALGAASDCYARLNITGEPGKLLIEGYEGVWKVDLKRQGCEAIERETLKVSAPQK
jgi:broad specificity phosphatase PhoE